MQDGTDDGERSVATRVRELQHFMSVARRQTGKSWFTQLREIRELRTMGGRCGATDYYWYRLYDDGYLKGRGRRDFLGWRLLQQFSLALNPRYAVLPAWDKIVFAQLAGAAGLPVAPMRACFHPATKLPDSVGLHLRTVEDAARFLRDRANYPMFGKPAFSQGGRGAAYLASYDPATDRIVLLDGRSVSVDEFVRRLVETVDRRFHKPQCGYLFQPPLRPASEIVAITDWSAVCSVRVVCLNAPEGVRVLSAAWKIAVAPSHTDNFGDGDLGTLLAGVDLATGEVSGAVGGFWPDTQVYERHPVTGRRIEGFRLPGWDRVLDACHRAGAVFSLMRVHHWDFALTDDGPVIMELNDIGGTRIPQMHGRGLLDEQTREFVKRHANAAQHPWVKAL